jgi:hypothetical protein
MQANAAVVSQFWNSSINLPSLSSALGWEGTEFGRGKGPWLFWGSQSIWWCQRGTSKCLCGAWASLLLISAKAYWLMRSTGVSNILLPVLGADERIWQRRVRGKGKVETTESKAEVRGVLFVQGHVTSNPKLAELLRGSTPQL